ncbi:: FliJ [Gemmataceae bacterium]|nr:: FliJ [Gemmataceae bacterium]VTT97899.1 : FliJ [Gemmataceae bacterium]
MKRFEFALDQVLKVKRQLERFAELEQQRAAAAAERAAAARQQLNDQLARVAERFTSAVGSAMAPGQWAAASDLTERLGYSLARAEEEVAVAERHLRDASQKRTALATEVEALQTLRQQQWEQWKRDSQKAEQGQLDEVGLRRWMTARDRRTSDSLQAGP